MHSHNAGTRTFETPVKTSGTTDTDQYRSLLRNDSRDHTERAQYKTLQIVTTYAALHSFKPFFFIFNHHYKDPKNDDHTHNTPTSWTLPPNHKSLAIRRQLRTINR